jgi:hypothetical protein
VCPLEPHLLLVLLLLDYRSFSPTSWRSSFSFSEGNRQSAAERVPGDAGRFIFVLRRGPFSVARSNRGDADRSVVNQLFIAEHSA